MQKLFFIYYEGAKQLKLDAFCEKFSARVGDRFLVYTKDLCKDGAVTLLPVMMTMFI